MGMKIYVIGIIVVFTLVLSSIASAPGVPSLAFASTVGAFATQDLSEEEKEIWLNNQNQRPAINPDFDPDDDCNIAYELKCIPGTEQDCPEGYHNGEDNVCSPVECQEGYHGIDDDETGLCYPDSEPCYPGHLSNPNSTNCSDEDWICEKFNLTSCMVDGRMIGTFPDEGCLRSPDQDKCAAINFECPDGFVTASISNLTMTPCLPLSYENAEEATKDRQIHDQNRCPPGYNLEDIDEEPEEEYGNVGECVPNK